MMKVRVCAVTPVLQLTRSETHGTEQSSAVSLVVADAFGPHGWDCDDQ